MKLDENELLILGNIYDGTERELNTTYKPTIAPNEREAKQKELVYYLDRLERNGLVEILKNDFGKYYLGCGGVSNTYKNDAYSCPDWTKINLSIKGEKYVENIRKSKREKLTDYITKKLTKSLDEIFDESLKYGIVFIIGVLFGNIGKIFNLIKDIISKI